jgi:hypothetical protein
VNSIDATTHAPAPRTIVSFLGATRELVAVIVEIVVILLETFEVVLGVAIVVDIGIEIVVARHHRVWMVEYQGRDFAHRGKCVFPAANP